MTDPSLGGKAASELRKRLGKAQSDRFFGNLFTTLDRDGNGEFSFMEFALAFAPCMDEDGEYVSQGGLYGAQIHALSVEYEYAISDNDQLTSELDDLQGTFDR